MPDLPFLDSFDHYLTAQIGQKWTSAVGIGIGSGNGRRGSNAAQVQGSGGYKTFDQEYGTLYCGAAIAGRAATVFKFYNQLSGVNIALCTVGDGRMILSATDPTDSRWFAPPLFSTASKPFLNDRWYYIELKAAVTASGISAIVRVNEEVVITESCLYYDSSKLISHVAWATFQIFGLGGGAWSTYDDLYVDPDGFYGDVNIDVIRPDGPATSNWIPTPNVANYLNVKDITPDGDATTVSSANANDLDLYTMQDIPPTAVVRAIQGIASVKKDTAGLAALKLQYGSGSGAKYSGEFYPSELAYIMLRDGRKDILNPADINNLVFGQLRTK